MAFIPFEQRDDPFSRVALGPAGLKLPLDLGQLLVRCSVLAILLAEKLVEPLANEAAPLSQELSVCPQPKKGRIGRYALRTERRRACLLDQGR